MYHQYKGLYGRSTSSETMSLGPSLDSRWGWLAMVDRLSNGDITKHDAIYDRNYIECLNLLSYWHERDKYLEQVSNTKK
jgi:hypothetical protein